MSALELSIDQDSSPSVLVIRLKKGGEGPVPNLIEAAQVFEKRPVHIVILSESGNPLDSAWSYYVLLLAELASHYHRQVRFVGDGSAEIRQWIDSQGGLIEFKTSESLERAIDELEVQYAA